MISETARKNHDELFPGHVSTLKVTDPELIEIFDNFAFDETLRHSRLDTRTRLMVQLGGCDPQVRGHAAANLNVGNDRQLLISVITDLLPFIGYPRTLNALAAINEIAPASSEGH
jgi:4-carboxymuconolactone decarboxylase